MSNIINKIRLSGTDYTLSATSSGGITSGEVQTMIDESVSGITERMAEDEEVTAAALNNLNDRISGISGNNAVEVTQAEYDALVSGGTVDPTAFYIITDATPVDISNYWTSAQTNSAINAAVSGKVDTSTFNTYSGNVETALSGKQDTLSAGTGISIVDNVISATGGGGGKAVSGGTNISITTGETADTINCTLPISAGTNVLGVVANAIKMGENTTASSVCSFAMGTSTLANGYRSFAGGVMSRAWAETTFAYGTYVESLQFNETAFGKYNVSNKAIDTWGDSGNTLFSVGNGTADNARHNAFEIRQNGDIYLSLNGQDVKLQDQLGGSSITVDSALSSTSENPVQNKVIYNKIDEVEQVTARALNELNDAVSGKVDTSTYNTYTAATDTALGGKQATLVSGTNIKTINNESILGSGNIDIQGGGSSYSAGRGISIANDTISVSLPISAGTGTNALVVGGSTTASGINSFAGGDDAIASGNWSFAFGRGKATKQYTFAANGVSRATRDYSAAFNASEANNTYAFSCGTSKSNGYASFASGWDNKSLSDYESSFGYYNVSNKANTTFGDSGNTLFSVGNGTADNARHNAFEIRQNGDIYCSDGTNDVKLQDTITATAANTTALGGLSIVKLTQAQYDALATKDNSTLYVIVN